MHSAGLLPVSIHKKYEPKAVKALGSFVYSTRLAP